MALMDMVVKLRARALGILDKLGFLPGLLLRLSLFSFFTVESGWGKIHNLDNVTSFFTDLGIPAPHLNAILVSVTELVCGSLLLVGLFARLAAAPLVGSMAVAIVTAKWDKLDGIWDLLSIEEFLAITMLVAVIFYGPGKASVDHFLARWLDKQAGKKPETAAAPTTG